MIVRKRLTESQISELQAKVVQQNYSSGQQRPRVIFLNADQPYMDDIPKFYLDERLDYLKQCTYLVEMTHSKLRDITKDIPETVDTYLGRLQKILLLIEMHTQRLLDISELQQAYANLLQRILFCKSTNAKLNDRTIIQALYDCMAPMISNKSERNSIFYVCERILSLPDDTVPDTTQISYSDLLGQLQMQRDLLLQLGALRSGQGIAIPKKANPTPLQQFIAGEIKLFNFYTQHGRRPQHCNLERVRLFLERASKVENIR